MARVFPFPFHPELEVGPAPIGDLCTVCQRAIAPGELGFLLPHYDDSAAPQERPIHRLCLLGTFGAPVHVLENEHQLERLVIASWQRPPSTEDSPPPMTTDAPLFHHHCASCTCLGRYRWSRALRDDMDFDLYHCVDHHPRGPRDLMPTVVARFGHEDEQEFISADIARSLFAGHPDSPQATALAEALRRAMRRRLPLVPEDLIPGGPPRRS